MLRLACCSLMVVLWLGGCSSPGPRTMLVSTPEVAVATGYAQVPDGQLYYEAGGSGEVLVLVHGNAGDLRHWDLQVEDLRRHYQVVRYDVRGFGRSTVPQAGHPYSNFDDLAALLDHLGVTRAHVAGWSMGSGIVIDFSLAYPDRTISVISVGPWVNGYTSATASEFFADVAHVREVAKSDVRAAAVAAWMAAPFFSKTIVEPAAGERFKEIASDYSFWALLNQSPQRGLRPSAVSRLADIEVPLLIVTAERDVPACLEIADLLQQSVPHVRMVVMQGTGHLMHMEKPTEFNRVLLDHLDSLPRTRN